MKLVSAIIGVKSPLRFFVWEVDVVKGNVT